MRQFALLSLLGALFISSALATQCIRRKFKYDSVVCVCTAKSCPPFEPIIKTPPGRITMYFSGRNGDRFDRTSNYFFMKTPMKNVDIPLSITINRNKTYQKILGFGGAFTDAAGLHVTTLPAEVQNHLIRDYFGDEGLQYTLGRIPVGGTDFSVRPYSYDDNPNDELLSKFALQKEDLQYKIPFIQMAQKAAGKRSLKLFGSTWSPPAWMKENKQLIHGGQLIGEPGTKYYKIFAEYLTRFVEEYQKKNVTLWGMTIVNEPILTPDQPNQRFNSLAMNATQERDFLKYDLGPLLTKAGLAKLKVMVFDNNIDAIENYVTTVLSDKDAAKYAAGIAFHWYNNAGHRDGLSKIAEKFPNHFLLSTEACMLRKDQRDRVQLGNWDAADRYAEDIIRDLNQQTVGWVDWNLALGMLGGPNWVNNFVDAPIIVNDKDHEYYKQPTYYVLAHFSRFLPESSIRIDHSLKTQNAAQLHVTVFERPDKATVLTALNQLNHQVLVEVHDPAHGYYYFNLGSHTIATLIWY